MIRDIFGFVAFVFLLQLKGTTAVCTIVLYNDNNQTGDSSTLVGPGIYIGPVNLDFRNDAVSSVRLSSAIGDEICCAYFYTAVTDGLDAPLEYVCVSEDSLLDYDLIWDNRLSKLLLEDSVFVYTDNKILSDQIDDTHSDINKSINELETEISNVVTTLGTCFCENEINNTKNEIINEMDNVKNEIINEILSILRSTSDSSDTALLSGGSINEEFDSTDQQAEIITITIDREIFYISIGLGAMLLVGMFIIVVIQYKSNHYRQIILIFQN